MAVEQPLREFRRVVLREVLRAQPPHRGNERAGVSGELQCEAIGTPFVRARQGVRNRRQDDRQGAARQQ